MDWDKEVLEVTWKRKYGRLIDPFSNEVLAKITLKPRDFTRRGLDVKVTKWLASHPKNEQIASYLLDRFASGGIAVKGDSNYISLVR